MAARTLDAFSTELASAGGGPSTTDGSPSQGSQAQFDNTIGSATTLVSGVPGTIVPTNNAVTVDDLVAMLAYELGPAVDFVAAMSNVNGLTQPSGAPTDLSVAISDLVTWLHTELGATADIAAAIAAINARTEGSATSLADAITALIATIPPSGA